MAAKPLEQFENLSGRVVKTDSEYFAFGGFGELWKGKLTYPDGSTKSVAMKFLRGIHTNPAVLKKTTERLRRESCLWHRLQNPNILPFLGVCDDIGPSPALISPFYKFGDVLKYLGEHPNADRLNIITGVANGLNYLHSPIHCYSDSDATKLPIIHGDLKGNNILVDDTGAPRLCDFGRAKLVGSRGMTTTFAGSIPYMAPELSAVPSTDEYSSEESTGPITEPNITTFKPNLTQESDIYAFAMVVIEITSGKTPFYHIPPLAIGMQVVEGKRPRRKRHTSALLTDNLWKLLTECWDQQPGLRPDICTVIERLALCS